MKYLKTFESIDSNEINWDLNYEDLEPILRKEYNRLYKKLKDTLFLNGINSTLVDGVKKVNREREEKKLKNLHKCESLFGEVMDSFYDMIESYENRDLNGNPYFNIICQNAGMNSGQYYILVAIKYYPGDSVNLLNTLTSIKSCLYRIGVDLKDCTSIFGNEFTLKFYYS